MNLRPPSSRKLEGSLGFASARTKIHHTRRNKLLVVLVVRVAFVAKI